jgi:carbonic anhydrase/acetyltransferase-like protein (isoleucine patch superfamily)
VKKYKLTDETKTVLGVKLFRIESEMSFANVKKGDKGGWVESEYNLSQCGKAWVYGEAEVCGKAWVSGEARVYGKARVSGEAWVHGEARVSGKAWVHGEARVYGKAKVYGEAKVYGKAKVYGEAWVYGKAWVCGEAEVHGKAWVHGEAEVHGKAKVYGEAEVCAGSLTKNAINIVGMLWNITITTIHIKIGCRLHTYTEWSEFNDSQISLMDDKALDFWRKMKKLILDIHKSHFEDEK